jgi:methylmalonyl-CoA/ethylmalonyl-CoA epimerase
MDDQPALIQGGDLDQIGIVVNDLHAFTRELKRLFGIGPFRIIEWPVEGIDPQSTYHGQKGDYRLLLAFANVGKIQVEIVQPLEGENIYSDFLRDHGPGIHHFRMTIPEFEQGVEAMLADGIKNIASGTGVHVGSQWAYFDTTQILEGVTVELRTRLDDGGGKGVWVQPVSHDPPHEND